MDASEIYERRMAALKERLFEAYDTLDAVDAVDANTVKAAEDEAVAQRRIWRLKMQVAELMNDQAEVMECSKHLQKWNDLHNRCAKNRLVDRVHALEVETEGTTKVKTAMGKLKVVGGGA